MVRDAHGVVPLHGVVATLFFCCWSYHAGQQWNQENSTIWLSKSSLASVWEEGSQGPHINSPYSWGKIKIRLVVEYHLLQSVCRPALVSSTPLQLLLNVDIGKQRFPDVTLPWNPALLSSRRTAFAEARNPARITFVAGSSSMFLEFHHGPWYSSSRKCKQFCWFCDRGACHRSYNNSPFFKLIQVTHLT